MSEDIKKYKSMENVLNSINKKCISLSDDDRKRNNKILKELLDLIIPKMKENDSLFKEMYKRVFYGGSYYDGLRVGQPDEFDLDLLMTLPKLVEPVLSISNLPGFVHLKFNDFMTFHKQTDMVVRYKGLVNLIDNKSYYLDTENVRRWMESVVTRALNTFNKNTDGRYILKTSEGPFYAKICKGGPAFTMKVEGNISNKKIVLDIDLVPCFILGKDTWPSKPFRQNSVETKPEYFIVPKPLKDVANSSRYWRLSFQEQEREIMEGKRALKPTIKLLKRLRDIQNHKCIASYYIKTVSLWQTDKRDREFWNNSLSVVFMNILKDYHECLNKKNIPYYWNKNNNLIGKVKQDTLINVANKIKLIIDDIEKHPNDPFVIAKYLLKADELNNFKKEHNTTYFGTFKVK
nr:cyclic GMP-AMP synthase-like isoform X1 [Leptinotarsa decemlineata]